MPTLSKTSTIDAVVARAMLYRSLGLIFRYPDASVQQELRSPAFLTEFLEACTVIEVVDLLPQYHTGKRELDEMATEALTHTYIRTFGHTAQSQIPLYETEYGQAQTLRGVHELGDIAGFYRAFGLTVTPRVHERVDSVTVECAFQHVLCYKEAYAMQHHGDEQRTVCRETQRNFLQHHLGWWTPSMLRRVVDVAPPVYGAWAHLGLLFIQQEHQRCDLPQPAERLGLRTPEASMETGCMSCSAETACPGGGTDAVAV
jgi:TorA maturation chaperone TorD